MLDLNGPWTAEDVGPTEAVTYKVRDKDGKLVLTMRSVLRADDEEATEAELAAVLRTHELAALVKRLPELVKALEEISKLGLLESPIGKGLATKALSGE